MVVQGSSTQWNAEHRTRRSLSSSCRIADQQRAQMIQNAETESDAYSVISVDNVWTAEFAANRYIVELPEDEFPVDEMLEPVIDSARYLDKLYAIPSASDGGMLYYRTDLLEAAGIAEPPGTWQEMIDQCEQINATPKVRASLATRANSRSTRASPSTPPRRSTALAAWSPTTKASRTSTRPRPQRA